MKNALHGIGKIFSFTFVRQTKSKGFLILTVLLFLILLILPAAILPLAENASATEDVPQEIPEVATVYFASKDTSVDFSVLSEKKLPGFEKTSFVPCADLDEALGKAASDHESLVLSVTETQSEYRFACIVPEASLYTDTHAEALSYSAYAGAPSIIAGALSLTGEQAEILSKDIAVINAPYDPDHQGDPGGDVDVPSSDVYSGTSVLGFIVPFVNVMVIYFLVLFYGQQVANSIIMEKTSKLMDTFLISVRSEAMVFGKMAAICAAAILQFSLWVAAVFAGFGIGSALVRAINPDSDMLLLRILDYIKTASSGFSPLSVVTAVLLIAAGFLMYCALSAIGGSLAGKPEDLSSTNSLFTIALVVSYFITLSSGLSGGAAPAGTAWYDFFPFTAILSAPAKLILGQMPLWQGLVSLVIVIAASAVLTFAAGRVYKAMALYKGNPPKPTEIFTILSKNK